MNPFTQHPASVGESYIEHLVAAGSFSVRLFIAAAVCLVHAVLPFLFEKTGSAMITALYDKMVANRVRHVDAADIAAEKV
ncbi:MAG: DUF6356 family protein [Pseudomonadota bacterium]